MTENNHALPIGYELKTYTIDRILGQGGFGIVYQAHHSILNDKFVIKEFLPSTLATRSQAKPTIVPVSHSNDALFQDNYNRFIQEGQTLRKLKHPNIVRCTDLFNANGTAYLVMEFEDGLAFNELLSSLEATGGQYSEEQLLQVFIPLAEGLEYVHQQNVLHRDIKPGNIFIRRSDNSPVLLDFGAAKQNFAEVSQSQAPFTEFYAPIDQLDTTTKPTPAIDIHAFGGLMYRAVTGQVGPKAEKRSFAITRGQGDPLAPASQLAKGKYSEGLLQLIDQCLAFLPENRPQSMHEVHQKLQQLSHGTQETPRSRSSDQNTQFRALIDLAGSDGIITEVEMEHLLNKAKEFGLDQVSAIQQITQLSHINGWQLELAYPEESKTQPDVSAHTLSPQEQRALLDPLINMAGADGVITESEMTHVIEHGLKHSINPNFIQQYLKERAQQEGWQFETKSKDDKTNSNAPLLLTDVVDNNKRFTTEQTKLLLDNLIKELRARKPIEYDKLNVDFNNVWIGQDFKSGGFLPQTFLKGSPNESIEQMELYCFAPEFFLGQKIEQSSVVYSLATIAYYCLTGDYYFTDQRLEDDNFQPLSGFGDENFTDSINWAMQLKKNQRPSSINQWVKSWTQGVPANKQSSTNESSQQKQTRQEKPQAQQKQEPNAQRSNENSEPKQKSQAKPKPEAKAQQQNDRTVERERPRLNYQCTFLDYLDTFFEFLNTALIFIILGSIGWFILGAIIEAIGDFNFKNSTHGAVVGFVALISIFISWPSEVVKNGLKKEDDRYSNIHFFFGALVFIAIVIGIIYWVKN